MEISFPATSIASVMYLLVWLLTTQEDFNMDRLLHRDQYAVKEAVEKKAAPVSNLNDFLLARKKSTRWTTVLWLNITALAKKVSIEPKLHANVPLHDR